MMQGIDRFFKNWSISSRTYDIENAKHTYDCADYSFQICYL